MRHGQKIGEKLRKYTLGDAEDSGEKDVLCTKGTQQTLIDNLEVNTFKAIFTFFSDCELVVARFTKGAGGLGFMGCLF